MDLIRHDQAVQANACFHNSIFQEPSMNIISDLTDKSHLPAAFCQHGQDISRCAARILLQDRISLGAQSGGSEVDQKLSQRCHIIVCHCLPLSVHVSYSCTLMITFMVLSLFSSMYW